MHVDTGHNFPEVIEYRDRRVAELGERLVVASVQESIDTGRVVEQTGPRASRNQLQTTTLLDAMESNQFDAAIGGARRDEERSRAKERIFSFRDDFGQWDPRAQRPELWNLYNGKIRKGEQVRVFPISNWTELDVWQYVARESLELPSIYYAHEREVFERDGMLYATSDVIERDDDEMPFTGVGALPHGRRHELHGRRALARDLVRRRRRRDRRDPRHRARRDPRRRPRLRGRDGGPETCRILLSRAGATRRDRRIRPAPPRHLRLGRRRQVDADRPAALRHEAGLRRPDGAVEETSERRGDGYVNLALLTDGLRAEREQGITIDVAYRGFVTPKRRFQLADAPGHVQYTRNMVTGASTADVAVVLVDARKGVIEQTRRHTLIASLLAVPHLVFAVNKMDLVDFDEARFNEIAARARRADRRARRQGRGRDPDRRAPRRQRRRRLRPDALVAGRHAAPAPRGDRARGRPQPRRPPLPRAVGDPADVRRVPRLPRLRGPGRRRRLARGRRRARAPVGPAHARRVGRDLRRPDRRGDARDVGHDPARGRDRRAARRHARRPGRPAGHARARSRRRSAG